MQKYKRAHSPVLSGDSDSEGRQRHKAPLGTCYVMGSPAIFRTNRSRFSVAAILASKEQSLGSFSRGFGLPGMAGSALCCAGSGVRLFSSTCALRRQAVVVQVGIICMPGAVKVYTLNLPVQWPFVGDML